MKRLLIIGLFVLVACKNNLKSQLQIKQEKAEATVEEYLHIPKYSDSVKHLKFTKLTKVNKNFYEIGLVGAEKDKFGFREAVYFSLDSSCNKVKIFLTR